MNTYQVGPHYWEKCAGEEPVLTIEADTPQEAMEKARPYPWNVTFGVRARLIKGEE